MSKLKVAAISAGLIGILLVWKFLPVAERLAAACEIIESWGTWGVLAYLLLYTGLVVGGFPNTPLNIGAGVLFGLGVGFAIAMSGGVLGSAICFMISRHIARDLIAKQIDNHNGRWLLDAVDTGGIQVMLLARLNPFLPSSLKDYGFGITNVSFWKFVLATALGQAPIQFAYVYLGWTGTVTLTRSAKLGSWHYLLMAFGVAVSIALAAVLAWYSRRKVAVAA